MDRFTPALAAASLYLERVASLQSRYRAGEIHVHLPAGFSDSARPLSEVVAADLPVSRASLDAASNGLFYSLPIAFDPAESVGPYLATADRDASGEPYRFMDLGALIASQPFGENDPDLVARVLRDLPYAVARYAHSEYQTVLSLRLKAALDRIAPAGAPRHFVVNTGAEAVENAIKAVLLNRVKTRAPETGQVSSETPPEHTASSSSRSTAPFTAGRSGAWRRHRRRARLGFRPSTGRTPASRWRTPGHSRTRRRDEKSLEQVWGCSCPAGSPASPGLWSSFDGSSRLATSSWRASRPSAPPGPTWSGSSWTSSERSSTLQRSNAPSAWPVSSSSPSRGKVASASLRTISSGAFAC
jgi:hypothetical protein